MSILTKVGLGAALAATALTAAAPADAQYYRGGYGYRHGGGDAAAGAIIGGVIGLGLGAAIANSNRDRYYDRGYYYAPPPRVVYRERYYAPPPRVIVRERYYDDGYYDRGGYYDRYDRRGYYGY